MAKSVNGGGGGGGSGDDNGASSDSDSTTPICRCRVLYLGSAVPHITKDGLQGIQEPLKDLYPEQGVFWSADREHCATGIDSWLSVWSNGILVENVDDKGNTVRRFHPIESLHYCAAVRYVSVPEQQQQKGVTNGNGEPATTSNNKVAKFLPLDSPFSKSGSSSLLNMGDGGGVGHPPLFACILRRTSGIKVLECHAFICKKEAAANALVRCCFHAYADTMHARQIEMESPYEQLDKRRSRSIGSALDAQSLRSIDEKVTAWQKSSTGSSTTTTGGAGGSGEDSGTADAAILSRSISRQKARTPSLASLASHHQQVGNGEVNGHHHHHPHHLNGHHQHGPPEPIYYNGIGNGTLRSVKSFISLATLRGSSKKQQQQQMRPRQIPMPMSALPPPPPVMFATMSKKQLKALQKESTLKRKHKYKEGMPAPFLPNGPFGQLIFGPPPPPPHMMHPLYGPLPPPGPPPGLPPHPGAYFTIDRKGRVVGGPAGPPPGAMMHHGPPPPLPIMAPPENGGMIIGGGGGHPNDEPIYMPTLSSPNGTLMRPMTPHRGSMVPVEPIYGGGPPPHHPAHLPPHLAGPPPPPMTFIPHPQTGELVACTLIPTLSRKELKELEKAKAKLKKAAKKEKKQMKNGKGQMMPLPSAVQQQQQQQQQLQMQHEQMVHEQMYQTGGGRHQQGPPPPPPFPYAGEHPSLEQQQQQQAAQLHHEEMLLREGHPQASFNSNSSSSAVGGIGGGIYKKKGHLNERAFSYSIRQEHRSRSNSLSNLAFDSPLPVHNGHGNGNGAQTPRNGNGDHNHHHHQEMMTTTTTSSSNHASSVSLKSNHTGGENGGKHQHYNGEYSHSNGGHHHQHQQQSAENGKHYQAQQQQQQMHNGGGGQHHHHHSNGRINASNGSLQALAAEHGIDPNVLASRMSNLKLNGGGAGGAAAPPPPPLPPNGYHNGNAAYQKTATIKRL
ncbi:hypothetical protein TYRP_007389 [Tyrophagus putrescentiae]|nr:hypothetical protein TYRP_007389 [Tyrophagus putrescentiae]